MHCIKCSKEAVEYVRYSGAHLCEEHFLEYVERRVKREVRLQVDLDGMSTVAVALSGGKDSSVALYIVHQALKQRRDISIVAITVDEGIAGYRPQTIEKAHQLTGMLDVEHHVISFEEELGKTMDEIVEKAEKKGPCTYCGVLRRRCMNKMARDLGADVLATGLNLDDTAQSILMNFTRGDVERLARLGPHRKVQPGLIPRIQPLRSIPERESYLYAMLRQLPFSDEECPYSDLALRNEYRSIVDGLEARHTGTKFAIVASYDAVSPSLAERFPQADLKLCECGEPTCNPRCMACELLEEMRKTV